METAKKKAKEEPRAIRALGTKGISCLIWLEPVMISMCVCVYVHIHIYT